MTVLFKPLSGILNQNKLLPLRYAPITIELELVDDALEPIISNVPDEAPEEKPFSFDKKQALFFGLSIMFK